MKKSTAYRWSSVVLGAALALGTALAQQGGTTTPPSPAPGTVAPGTTTPGMTAPGTTTPGTPTTATPPSPVEICGLAGTGTTGAANTGTGATGMAGTGTGSTGNTGTGNTGTSTGTGTGTGGTTGTNTGTAGTGTGTTGTGTTSTGTAGTGTAGTGAATRLSSTDTCFIQQAALSDLFEIQSSQVAENRASHANVKSFARQMIQDHTKASQELKNVAGKLGVAVPTTLSGPKVQILNTLRDTPAANFDRTYIDAQVLAHEQAVNLFNDYIRWSLRSGGNASLRAHATKTLPVLREHLQHVRNLQQALGK